MLIRASGLEVGGVVCAVNVVSGLPYVSNGAVCERRSYIHGPKPAVDDSFRRFGLIVVPLVR